MMIQNALFLAVLYMLALTTFARRHPFNPTALVHPPHRRVLSRRHDWTSASVMSIRGGSTAAEESEVAESPVPENSVDNGKPELEDDGEEEGGPKPAEISNEPARILIQTNFGSSVLDHRIELMSARTKNIGALKKSVSKKLPGKCPLLGLELVFEGKVLDDEMLVDELFGEDEAEDEDDDEGEEEKSFKILTLNCIPPVDPKFATELIPKLKSHIEDDEDTLTTEEMLDAYFLNQASMMRNMQLFADPKAPASPLIRLEIQELAQQLKQQLRSQIPDDVWEKGMEATKRDHTTEEIKGQRYRSGKGGAKTSLKKTIQTNLNIDWFETIWNCLLLLFFGYFGGRNSLSRRLMLWGAPMVFFLQARPVKIWFKILFYSMSKPPGIISSLLPAPQQAILNFDLERSYAILYNPGAEEKKRPTNSSKGRSMVEKKEKVAVTEEVVDKNDDEEDSENGESEEEDSDEEDDAEE